MLGWNPFPICCLVACIAGLLIGLSASTTGSQQPPGPCEVSSVGGTGPRSSSPHTPIARPSPEIVKRVALQGFALGVLVTLSLGLAVTLSLILTRGGNGTQREQSSPHGVMAAARCEENVLSVGSQDRPSINHLDLPSPSASCPGAATLSAVHRADGILFQQILRDNLQVREASMTHVAS
jgi:hypothetical protein